MADVQAPTRPTAKQHEWIASFGGPDPRTFPESRTAQPADPAAAKPPGAPGAPAAPPPAAAAPGAPAGAPPAPLTPDQYKADLERRLKAHKELYDQVGQKGADAQLPPEERLTPAELNLGTMKQDAPATSRSLNDKGFTSTTTTTTQGAVMGPDGRPVGFTHDATSSLNIGPTGGSYATGTKATLDAEGRSTTIAHQDTKTVDLAKGDVSHATSSSVEVKTTPDASTKEEHKTTDSAGMSGVTRTTDTAHQTGDQRDATSTTLGVTRSDGQVMLGGSHSSTSGTMAGPADKQTMEKGTTLSGGGGGGLVSDDKGTGAGATGNASGKALYGHGVSLTDTVSGGGRCQSIVKEVMPATVPPSFTITTTISFDVTVGTTLGAEAAPKEAGDSRRDESGKGLNDGKVSVSVGGSVSLAKSASFTHTLSEAEAKTYLDEIAANGHGGSFPEHKLLVTGMKDGWAKAAELYAAMTHSAAAAKQMKPGEEMQSSQQVGAGVKGGASGGQASEGGGTVAVDASYAKTHKVTLGQKALPDNKLQLTASIDDGTEYGGAAGPSIGVVSGKLGASHGEGKTHTVVFVLDTTDPGYEKLYNEIANASSAAELDKIAAANHSRLASTTDGHSDSDGQSFNVTAGPVAIDMAGKQTFTDETTRDADGHEIGSKTTGSNQGGGSVSLLGVKAGDTTTTSVVASVTNGQATVDISTAKQATSFDKTMQNLGNAAHDPLGTVMHPGKLMGETVDTNGVTIGNAEIVTYCQEASDAAAWNKKIVGNRHDDWVQCGKAIRAATSHDKDGRIVVDLHAVEAALAQWQKADYSGNNDALTDIIRPLHGMPAGNAKAFPDGTQSIAADWDALMAGDPLTDANAKAKDGHIAEALATMQAVRQQVQSLSNRISTAAKKWDDAGLSMQRDEMLGHVNDRLAEIDGRIKEMIKLQPPATGQAGTGQAAGGAPGPAAADPAAQQRTKLAQIDLETYNNAIARMHGWSDDILKQLATIESDLKGGGSVADALKPLREIEQQLALWDKTHDDAAKLFATLKPVLNLDPARLEEARSATARLRWQTVNRLTKMAGMDGAGQHTGSFPPGAEKMASDWDTYMEGDPLADANKRASDGHIPEAIIAFRTMLQQVQSLSNRINTASKLWTDAGMQSQQADMLGKINDRITEINGRIRELTKQLPPAPAQPAKPGEPPADPAAAAKEAEDRARADEARADLEIYNNDIERMQAWSDAVFHDLGEVEAKLNSIHVFSNKADEARGPLADIDKRIATWDQTYWKAFAIFQKWSPNLNLDRSRIEKLHTAGRARALQRGQAAGRFVAGGPPGLHDRRARFKRPPWKPALAPLPVPIIAASPAD